MFPKRTLTLKRYTVKQQQPGTTRLSPRFSSLNPSRLARLPEKVRTVLEKAGHSQEPLHFRIVDAAATSSTVYLLVEAENLPYLQGIYIVNAAGPAEGRLFLFAQLDATRQWWEWKPVQIMALDDENILILQIQCSHPPLIHLNLKEGAVQNTIGAFPSTDRCLSGPNVHVYGQPYGFWIQGKVIILYPAYPESVAMAFDLRTGRRLCMLDLDSIVLPNLRHRLGPELFQFTVEPGADVLLIEGFSCIHGDAILLKDAGGGLWRLTPDGALKFKGPYPSGAHCFSGPEGTPWWIVHEDKSFHRGAIWFRFSSSPDALFTRRNR